MTVNISECFEDLLSTPEIIALRLNLILTKLYLPKVTCHPILILAIDLKYPVGLCIAR